MGEIVEDLRTASWAALGERVLVVVITVAAVVIAARILRVVSRRITQGIFRPRPGAADHDVQVRRALTMLPLILEVERYVIYFVAAVTVLAQLGVDTGAILASVGVVGLAVGFGAQNLVKDVISGFFLLFDGLVAVGDVVKLHDGTGGAVEAVGLRNTQLRDYSGLLWIVPNGELRQFGNFNRGWTRALVEVGIAYEADVRRAMAAVLETAAAWAAENADKVLEPPEVQALMGLGPSEVSLRLVIKLRAMEHWVAERELRLRLKEAFDRAGVEIPYPRRVLIQKPAAGG